MITPDTSFADRPMGVREPFDRAGESRYRLDAIAEDLSLELRRDRVASVQPFADTVRTASGMTRVAAPPVPWGPAASGAT